MGMGGDNLIGLHIAALMMNLFTQKMKILDHLNGTMRSRVEIPDRASY